MTGSASLNWQPFAWLETRAVTGLDQNANYGYRFARVGEGTNGGWGPPGLTGGRDATRNTYSRYSVDLGATASWQPLEWLTTRTSVGTQWFKDAQYETAVQGYQLPPGAQNPNGAVTQRTFEQTNENATYGAFVEEVLGWSDTRFLTLGVRTDQNSAFGRSVGNTIYPRAAPELGALRRVLLPEGRAAHEQRPPARRRSARPACSRRRSPRCSS